MRVRCPTCEAGYEIGDTLIGPGGRWVRCAACGNVWHVAPLPGSGEPPAAAEAPAEAPAEPLPEAPAAAEAAAPAEAPTPAEAHRPPLDTFAFAHAGAGVAEAPPPPAPASPAPPPPAPRPAPARAAEVAGAIPRRPAPERPPAAPAEERAPPRVEPPAAPPTSAGVWIGWLVTIVVLGAAVWAAIHYRVEIMAAWPPSEWVYAALGLDGR